MPAQVPVAELGNHLADFRHDGEPSRERGGLAAAHRPDPVAEVDVLDADAGDLAGAGGVGTEQAVADGMLHYTSEDREGVLDRGATHAVGDPGVDGAVDAAVG
ncbi:hypothetical protein [Streptomyces sp. CA2R106]|uniref:hypothetical protein n=1 Tax=Streptomyces sp. CA2R106 TaxID=3120153 RepID=UPI0030097819